MLLLNLILIKILIYKNDKIHTVSKWGEISTCTLKYIIDTNLEISSLHVPRGGWRLRPKRKRSSIEPYGDHYSCCFNSHDGEE